jgi:hypothetical protein
MRRAVIVIGVGSRQSAQMLHQNPENEDKQNNHLPRKVMKDFPHERQRTMRPTITYEAIDE